ncbi:MAG: hypothetical protein WKF73_06280 [Nocardioidaceae bacterium]
MAGLLVKHEFVRPQNFFAPLPWHARWDSARSLLNRAFGDDYPGTFGVQRSALEKTGGYCGADWCDGTHKVLKKRRSPRSDEEAGS